MKQIALFALPFFGYENHILSQFEKQGYKIHYISGRKGCLSDFFIALFCDVPKVYQQHIKKELERLPLEQIDIFLVIKGVNLTSEHIGYIKSRNPKMRFVMYQWDSVRNFNYTELIPYFDKVATFDFKDAEQLSLEYVPLFYTEDITPEPKIEENIDILLVGTYLPERFEAMRSIKDIAQKNNLKFYYHIFVAPSYFYKNIKRFWSIRRDLSTRQISREKLIELYRRSKTILDVSNIDQTGMSMRVVESYGMNKKLITSNPAIEKDANVCEIMRIAQPASESEVLKLIDLEVERYKNREKLSIESWTKRLLC